MANTLTARRLTAREQPKPITCKFCGDKVTYVRAPMVASKLKRRLMCSNCAAMAEVEAEMVYSDTSRDRPADPYCVECFEPYYASRPFQRRCTACAEHIAARWAVVPPSPKPPKLELVKQPEKLSPMVLWRAMWLQVWADWQRVHNPAVLIRRLDANIKAGPGVVKCREVPKWELWTEAEFQQRMVVPKVAVAA